MFLKIIHVIRNQLQYSKRLVCLADTASNKNVKFYFSHKRNNSSKRTAGIVCANADPPQSVAGSKQVMLLSHEGTKVKQSSVQTSTVNLFNSQRRPKTSILINPNSRYNNNSNFWYIMPISIHFLDFPFNNVYRMWLWPTAYVNSEYAVQQL